MKSDLYIKSVLTIIAVCLVYIAIKGFPPSYRLKNGKLAIAVVVTNPELDVNVTNPELDVTFGNRELDVNVVNKTVPIEGIVSVGNTVQVRGNFTENSVVQCPDCKGKGKVNSWDDGNCRRCRGTGRVTVE